MCAENGHTGGILINRIRKKLSEIIWKSILDLPLLSVHIRPVTWFLSPLLASLIFLSVSGPVTWLLFTTWPSSSLYPNLVQPCDSCTSLDIPHLFIWIWSSHVTPVHLLTFLISLSESGPAMWLLYISWHSSSPFPYPVWSSYSAPPYLSPSSSPYPVQSPDSCPQP